MLGRAFFRHSPAQAIWLPYRHGEAMSGNDKAFALTLLEKNGLIGETPVHQEGQMIRICEGAYQGAYTKTRQVNRRYKRMKIPFAGYQAETRVEYEAGEGEGDRLPGFLVYLSRFFCMRKHAAQV